MQNEVMTASKKDVVEIDYQAKATEWLQNMGTQLPPQQAVQFLELCQAYKLNPFKREIYAVGYGGKFNIIVGYEVYLKRAERTGKLNGWQCVANENGTKAKVTIWRKDWQHPFEHEVFMSEVKQNSPIWSKMPIFMMKKVCVEQGMRLCFPDEMGGMPYGEEELSYDKVIASEQPIEERNVTPAVVEQPVTVEQSETVEVSNLEKLVKDYEKQLSDSAQSPTPFEQASECLKNGTNDEQIAMYNRCVTWLGKKGIEVA